MTAKKPSQFRLTDKARELLVALASRLGKNLTEAVEYSIRETAKREGVGE